MSLAKETRHCPFCRETINAKAVRCKHCHADLSDSLPKRKSALKKYNTFRIGFLAGVCFAVALFVLAWYQFSA